MNPILQALNKVKNENSIQNDLNQNNYNASLNNNSNNNSNRNDGYEMLLFNKLMRTNPQFSQFVNQNKGKTPEEIANAYGVDISKILNLGGK